MSKVIIVGGVAGGASAAARLRRLDESMEIILFERGEYISFANCGLPYYVGDVITDRAELLLQTPESFHARFRVDVRTFQEVMSIDRSAKTVAIKNHQTGEEYSESYDTLILSPGAEPIRPRIPGVDSGKVFTLRNIPDTFAITDFIDTNSPKHAVVVGGGFIGIEMAENLTHRGIRVTLVELSDQIIAPLDPDMAHMVQRYMESEGVTFLLGSGVTAVAEEDGQLNISVGDGAVQADMLVLAIGVSPESGIAKEAELAVTARGCIVVDDHMRTSDQDIYAVGDAVEVVNFVTGQKGFIPLAGPANKQGRIAADNICGIPSSYKGTQGSSIIKVFEQTVASTGINEKMAKALGFSYDKVFTFPASHAGYYPGGTQMAMKTIFEQGTGKILGAQLVGKDGVDKRCDVLATAIRAGMTAADLAELELCYAPPYSSAKDPVNMAGFVIENLLCGNVKQFHWDQVADLPQDGSVTLLDVRTPWEYERGHMPGFVNIQVDELRDTVAELDATKPVYVTCQVGVRGYIAARILAQHGFDAYNLSGGYALYSIQNS